MNSVYIICFFTFAIHFSETIVYGMRLAGIRTRQIAISMSFVTSSLIVSRLSNMFQAPLLGSLVDKSILVLNANAGVQLEHLFRLFIFSGFIGSLIGAIFTPSAVAIFGFAIRDFQYHGSLPKVFFKLIKPKNTLKVFRMIRLPKLSMLKTISLENIPKTFLVMNMMVTSIYAIGVLCALLASAYLPDMRATANQLSGIVNGLATIMLTLFVDPSGARITDQAFHKKRPENDVKSVIFYLQMGRLFGVLIISQLLLKPLTNYIIWVTLHFR